MNEISWGGSGIEKVVYDYIVNLLPKGSSILEFGAGYVSTVALMNDYDLISIEHNPEFANINPNTILCDIKDGWFDLNRKHLKDEYDLIFIDGYGRLKSLDNMDIISRGKKILIHDTYREDEIELANKLSVLLNRPVTFFTEGDYWAVI